MRGLLHPSPALQVSLGLDKKHNQDATPEDNSPRVAWFWNDRMMTGEIIIKRRELIGGLGEK